MIEFAGDVRTSVLPCCRGSNWMRDRPVEVDGRSALRRAAVPVRVGMVVHDMGINALGRAYSLGLVVSHLGWEFRVVGPSSTGSLWPVIGGSPFARTCAITTGRDDLVPLADWATIVLAVKALPESFGAAADVARDRGRPLLLDIDDPDLEQRKARVRAQHGRVRGRHQLRALRRLRARALAYPTTVSNPVLQRSWGGTVVPHARMSRTRGDRPDQEQVNVGFIGTARHHKGIEVLRHAVEQLAGSGYRLTVTDDPPPDAREWEDWRGVTSFEEGLRLTGLCDIVAVPSLRSGYAPAQLPVKLVDAMMSSAAVVASDLEPIRWALGDAGLLCRPGSVRSLATRLRELRSSERRRRLGHAAHSRALAAFTPEAIAPTFSAAVNRALAEGFPAN